MNQFCIVYPTVYHSPIPPVRTIVMAATMNTSEKANFVEGIDSDAVIITKDEKVTEDLHNCAR